MNIIKCSISLSGKKKSKFALKHSYYNGCITYFIYIIFSCLWFNDIFLSSLKIQKCHMIISVNEKCKINKTNKLLVYPLMLKSLRYHLNGEWLFYTFINK